MLKQLKRIVYSVQDLSQAKNWYSDILGYPPLFDAPFAAIFVVGDCSLSLKEAINNEAPPNQVMEVYWEVDNVETSLEVLIKKGAVLHTPIATALNIRTARVIDPFGNILGLTDQKTDSNDKPVEEKPSETALTVAFCRALAFKDTRKEIQGPDYLAEIFLNVEAKELLSQAKSRKWAAENLVTLPLYGYFLARTAYMDEVFSDYCNQEIPQIVLLGAGYDSRAIRFNDAISKTIIYELDIPTTQNRKLEHLQRADIVTPASIIYVPINFETDDLHDVLRSAGYNPRLQTLFVWEGVMYYLTRTSIESTLKFISEYSGIGSMVCFDCLREGLQSVNPAEPFRFWMTLPDLKALLSDHGMTPIESIETEEMVTRYLTFNNNTQAEKCLTSFYFMLAKKN